MDRASILARPNDSIRVEREPQNPVEAPREQGIQHAHIRRQSLGSNNSRKSNREYERNIQGGNTEWDHKRDKIILQPSRPREGSEDTSSGSFANHYEIGVRCPNSAPRQRTGRSEFETQSLPPRNRQDNTTLERANTPASTKASGSVGMVIATFNCRGWNSSIMRNLIEELSENHSKQLILACQETWRFEIPTTFRREFEEHYYFIHEAAMDPSKKRKKGRPYGGIAFILSKSIAFKNSYSNSRCMSILLTQFNILVNNVYLPANDTRITAEQNEEAMREAMGHLGAAHGTAEEVLDSICLGDFNFDPSDRTARTRIITEPLTGHNYDLLSDLSERTSNEYTHESGRTLDRILFTYSILQIRENVKVMTSYRNSDHFPVVADVSLEVENLAQPKKQKYLCWDKASEKAIDSYCRLSQKMCSKSLAKFKDKEISGAGLYQELLNNMSLAANHCIPKADPNKTPRQHNIPMWREQMSSYKTDVDYWLGVQFMHGGPRRCSSFVKQQLRLSKSRYRRQFRNLRREIETNIAESVTLKNCHRQLFKKPKTAPPTMIEGHSRSAQPLMWREHFRNVFCAEETIYQGDILHDVKSNITSHDVSTFNYINLCEINNVILEINTNKSYKRHHHWKNLRTENHAAKLCLTECINFFINNELNNRHSIDWDFFLTALELIPKKGKKGYPQRVLIHKECLAAYFSRIVRKLDF